MCSDCFHAEPGHMSYSPRLLTSNFFQNNTVLGPRFLCSLGQPLCLLIYCAVPFFITSLPFVSSRVRVLLAPPATCERDVSVATCLNGWNMTRTQHLVTCVINQSLLQYTAKNIVFFINILLFFTSLSIPSCSGQILINPSPSSFHFPFPPIITSPQGSLPPCFFLCT